jgi:hypothetical protein
MFEFEWPDSKLPKIVDRYNEIQEWGKGNKI